MVYFSRYSVLIVDNMILCFKSPLVEDIMKHKMANVSDKSTNVKLLKGSVKNLPICILNLSRKIKLLRWKPLHYINLRLNYLYKVFN